MLILHGKRPRTVFGCLDVCGQIAAESKSWSSKFEDGQLKAAETEANVFSLTAQLKDVSW